MFGYQDTRTPEQNKRDMEAEDKRRAERKLATISSSPTTLKLALKAENALFELLALSGEPVSKDTEIWLTAAALLIRRGIESMPYLQPAPIAIMARLDGLEERLSAIETCLWTDDLDEYW